MANNTFYPLSLCMILLIEWNCTSAQTQTIATIAMAEAAAVNDFMMLMSTQEQLKATVDYVIPNE